jgi:hypothetical protein
MGHLELCSMLGLDPGHSDTAEEITRYRDYCANVGLDSNDPESVAKVELLRNLAWKISAMRLDRWGNIHGWMRVRLEEGEAAADKVAAKQRAERRRRLHRSLERVFLATRLGHHRLPLLVTVSSPLGRVPRHLPQVSALAFHNQPSARERVCNDMCNTIA